MPQKYIETYIAKIEGKKYFFASDFHLGTPHLAASHEREERICRWLEACLPEAGALFLLGDVFDFWFEYKTVVPKGFLRLFSVLWAYRRAGIPVYVFVGNHDLWLGNYLEQELGLIICHQPMRLRLGQRQFFLAHGDGLGPGDKGYKRLRRVFTNPLCRWLFRWLHPDLGLGLAQTLSQRSRASQLQTEERFLGRENEWLLLYAERKLSLWPELDYFVFGHRHLSLDLVLSNGRSRYLNLGEWIKTYSYGVFDGQNFELAFFESQD